MIKIITQSDSAAQLSAMRQRSAQKNADIDRAVAEIMENVKRNGFAAVEDAVEMKWIIMPVTAPIAVAKIDNMRAFDPNEFQQAHAWKVDYRIFHDLWMMPDAQRCTIIRTGDIVD